MKIKNIFTKDEILSEENFYCLIKKKKIVVFVPDSHVDKVFSKMSDAGAGVIGNYDKCSFRINGTGSFRPNSKAKSFSGNSDQLKFENEVRHEMECCPHNLGNVVEAMIKAHPYEEIAYEIYDFVKLDKKITGKIINLNRKLDLKVIEKRLNKKLDSDSDIPDGDCKRVLISENLFDNAFKETAKFFDIDMILINRKNKFKFITLK